MSDSRLPERPSLEYLKKVAKERLQELRRDDPQTRLATAQLTVAREHGFPSWRALRAEVDRLRMSAVDRFFTACSEGDVAALASLLAEAPELVRARGTYGATGLHRAAAHPAALRLLLAAGADPDARDEGDHALALHFAAGGGHLESVRVLLDAGSDVQGAGDEHELDAIGWAACFADPHRDVVDLLVERGARHHVFTAVALGDLDLLRRLVEADPASLSRRLSEHEQRQSALHYVVAPPDGLVGGTFRTGDHHRTLERLIELGAELDAEDAKGRTALDLAMLRGDDRAMSLLHRAGARVAAPADAVPAGSLAALAPAMGPVRPMIAVPDVEATVAWYRAIGFTLTGSHVDDGTMNWASVSFGDASIMFVPGAAPAAGLSLWIDTARLDELYGLIRRRQMQRAGALLLGEPTDAPEVRFTADLHTAFYGQREFGFRDPNGVELMFAQTADVGP